MFDAYVAYHARVRPRAPAILTTQRRWTYAEFDADVNRYAAGLRHLGIGPERGVVAVETLSPYRRHVLFVALARLGVATGVSRDSRADVRLSDRPGESRGKVLRLTRDWINAVEAAPPLPVPSAPRDPEGTCRVLLSSGTTKTPRRVPISWQRMERSSLNGLTAYASGRLGVWAIRTGLDSGLGNALSILAWTVGAALAVEFPTPQLAWLMERHPHGLIGLTPVQLRDLLVQLPAGFELKPEWMLVVTGAALPGAVAREARARITPDIRINYGTTETGRAAVGFAARLETTPGHLGWAVPGAVVQVVDAEGRPLPDGEQGEIRIRSERVVAGYLGDEDSTSGAFRSEYFYPGDVGRRLPDGSFVIDGRVDERMNIGGIKVLPNVLEESALAYPGVLDAAAFSIRDRLGQEQCWLAVVAADALDRRGLMGHLLGSGQRLPRVRFAWTDEIPRSPTGKIDRDTLRAQTRAVLAAEGPTDT